MPINLNDKHPTILSIWKYPRLAKPESDGGYCYIIQRRISCYVSVYFMKLGLTPTQATLLDLFFGLLATLSIFFQYYLFGIFFIWLFGIWSCVDGEIARLSNRCSLSGDFFDTMTDRVIEMSVVIALLWSVFVHNDHVDKFLALTFIIYLGGVYLLAVSSEKYRSAVRANYPKKKEEYWFSWVSSGSDIRLLWLSVVMLTYSIMKDQKIMILQIGALSTVFIINFVVRMFRVDDLLTIKITPPVNAKTNKVKTFQGGLKVLDNMTGNLPKNPPLTHTEDGIDRFYGEQKVH